ncbi:hypothetical protein F4553_000572 [Allocatelliglobosispora scoriae]|uniref:Peptidase inhibitor family I36 n=1 Tax=Allocatelliglobosispora scoriae TaxID=643052 RepID=A0A841BJI1_9ACTN|nr:peptidase inhibitor family I36 protein [Allocatelliglobosispora scoriae]MBB5867193.1 hypothetical protein [Allocatelliglobosispora scoriae]
MAVRGRWAVIATVVLSLTAPPAPAQAAPTPAPHSAQELIDDYLAAAPGGVQIGPNEISYDGGKFVVTLTRPRSSLAATADCPSGWFCFYDGVNYTYPRGKLSDCGWQDLAWWGWHDRTESVHYNFSSGSVSYLNHRTQPDHSDDLFLFSVSSANKTDADVTPYRNMADHVYRNC